MKIIIYSKKDGTNKLLPIDSNDNLIDLVSAVERWYPEHKDFSYALINGVEIKLI